MATDSWVVKFAQRLRALPTSNFRTMTSTYMYPQEVPQPTKTLTVTSRVLGTKYVFTPSNGTDVLYYVLMPPKYESKHHWSAIVHAGDNPKYHSLAESPVIGRCKRTQPGSKYFIEYGGGVQSDVKKEEKAIKERKLRCSNRLRKCFCMEPKDLDWSAEDEAAIAEGEKGAVTKVLEMKRKGCRRYEFVVDWRSYRWSGTRMHSGGFINNLKLKGFAPHVKLIRVDDHKLIASFKIRRSRKNGKFGELNFYADGPETSLEEHLIVQTAFCVTRGEQERRGRSQGGANGMQLHGTGRLGGI